MTARELIDHLLAVGPYSGSIRWSKLWTNALPSYFDDDELGKLISIRKP